MPDMPDHIAALAPMSNHGISREGVIARAVDWVFGYDFFISYSHGDGMRLPRRIKERLEQAGFRVFLDQTEYVAGDDLRRETRRQVVKSRKIVVIGRPAALRSEWVRREVDVALAHGKTPVIVNLNGAVEAAPEEAALAAMARERHWLRLTETLPDPDGEPSELTVSELVRGFNHTRQETKRQRIFATAAAVLALAAGIATWQAIEATRARTVAEAERDRAQRTLNQVVATANRRVWALSLRLRMSESPPHDNEQPVACNDPLEIGRDGLPCSLKQAQIRLTRSATLLARNDGIGAIESAEAAVAILEGGAGARASDSAWQLARLEAGDQLVRAAEKVGDRPRALKALLTSLALAETLAKERPDEIKWEQALAGIEDGLGFLALQQKQYADAERHYQTALALRDRIAGRSDGAIEARRQQAIANGRIGDLLLAMEKPRQAAELYRGSITILESLVGTSSAAVELQRDLSVQYQHLADALTAAGSLEEAQHWLKKDVGIAQRLAAADRENPHLLHDLATSYDRLAKLAKRADRPSEALESYVEADRILEAIVGKDTSPADWQRDAAAVLESMGMLISERGDPNRAIATFRHALALREGLAASFEDTNWQTELEAAYKQTSESILKLGRAREALETAEQYLLATSLAPDQGADKPKRVARALGTVSWSALFARDVSRALWASKEAIAIAPQLDWLKLNYAHALMLSGDPEAARTVYLGGLAQARDKADAWRKDIRSDFAELKSRGLSHQLMAEIESSLNR